MLRRRFVAGAVAALALVLASAGSSRAQFFFMPIYPMGAMSPFTGGWGYYPGGVPGVNSAPRLYDYGGINPVGYTMPMAPPASYSNAYSWFGPQFGRSYVSSVAAVNPYTYAPNPFPYSAPSSVAVAPASYVAYYPPRFPGSAPTITPAAYVAEDRAATVEVIAPADAELWFDGRKTSQTGANRLFSTPPLEKGRAYHYDVRARWTQDGKTMDQTQSVPVYSGGRINVTFPKSKS